MAIIKKESREGGRERSKGKKEKKILRVHKDGKTLEPSYSAGGM